jgi:hypothetical protein
VEGVVDQAGHGGLGFGVRLGIRNQGTAQSVE